MNKRVISIAAALLFSAGSAQAAIITTFSNNFPGWTAAAGPSILEDFADTTLAPGLSIAFGEVLPGVISNGEYLDEAVTIFSTRNPLLSFTSPVLAFGADWNLSPGGSGGGLGLLLTFSDSTAEYVFAIPDSFTGEFFGFVSDTGVSSIQIVTADVSGEERFSVDNVRFPGSVSVPEPATLALLGLGLVGLGLSRRKCEC